MMRSSTNTIREKASIKTSSCSRTVAVVSGLGQPTMNWQNKLDEDKGRILFHVRQLYTGSLNQNKWKVMDPFKIEENEHDDLLVGVGASLRNFTSLGTEIGMTGIRKAF
jgi:hypothetical protein